MKTNQLVLKKDSVLTYAIPIAIFVGLMALASRVIIPLSITPVPITLQVFVVILSGLILGAKRAGVVQASYLFLILAGVPITAYGLAGPATFLSPTAGYLLAFLPAAYLIGLYSEKYKSIIHSVVAGLIGVVVIYIGGTAWLAVYLHDVSKAWVAGVVPFVGVDLVKAAFAVAIAKGLKGFENLP
jgi:biotin transport system substrate-specific component